jgi:hypothetical protein
VDGVQRHDADSRKVDDKVVIFMLDCIVLNVVLNVVWYSNTLV